jgi:3-oxoacyl-[acyl-carrier protein] reductase
LLQNDFTGRRALVTGAGSGIGRAIALELAAGGADVCLLDVNQAALRTSAAAVEEAGRRAVRLQHDTASESVIAAIEEIQSRTDFGPIDLLVNNAGISPKTNGRKRMSWEISPDDWRRVIDVNLNGYFYLLRAVLPRMIERRAGAIVNISSLAGHRYSAIAGAHYCASKAAVTGLTGQVAGEVAGFGIRVNAVAPGRIETEMAAEAGAGFNDEIKRSTPLGRLGIPQDIAQAVCFLLSDKASFITGQSLVVSGGRGL